MNIINLEALNKMGKVEENYAFRPKSPTPASSVRWQAILSLTHRDNLGQKTHDFLKHSPIILSTLCVPLTVKLYASHYTYTYTALPSQR